LDGSIILYRDLNTIRKGYSYMDVLCHVRHGDVIIMLWPRRSTEREVESMSP